MARKRRVFRSAKMARRQARKRRSKISERRKKEFKWRGYSMEELSEIPLYPPEEDPDAVSKNALGEGPIDNVMPQGVAPRQDVQHEAVHLVCTVVAEGLIEGGVAGGEGLSPLAVDAIRIHQDGLARFRCPWPAVGNLLQGASDRGYRVIPTRFL